LPELAKVQGGRMTTRLQIVGCILLSLVLGCRQDSPVFEPNNWLDQSPHQQGFLTTNGTRIEYLDWGGSGEPLVFLAGLGCTGHIYDEIAPQFTNDFRVIALTRRGTGASDKPTSGYEVASLTKDVLGALDALGIDRAILVGHSFGAQEVAALASAFPERVSKVVYLDGAYKFSPRIIELNERLDSFQPSPGPADGANIESLMQWYRKHKTGWNDACEGDFRETRVRSDQGISLDGSTPGFVFTAVMDDVMKSGPDFAKVAAPALAIFADHRLNAILAGLDEATTKKATPLVQEFDAFQREQVQRFRDRTKNATIVEITDTDHMCFTQRPEEVVQAMRAFLKSDSPH
jgi:pimeloyl-ACP methyl ester carboxylesterase